MKNIGLILLSPFLLFVPTYKKLGIEYVGVKKTSWHGKMYCEVYGEKLPTHFWTYVNKIIISLIRSIWQK